MYTSRYVCKCICPKICLVGYEKKGERGLPRYDLTDPEMGGGGGKDACCSLSSQISSFSLQGSRWCPYQSMKAFQSNYISPCHKFSCLLCLLRIAKQTKKRKYFMQGINTGLVKSVKIPLTLFYFLHALGGFILGKSSAAAASCRASGQVTCLDNAHVLVSTQSPTAAGQDCHNGYNTTVLCNNKEQLRIWLFFTLKLGHAFFLKVLTTSQ